MFDWSPAALLLIYQAELAAIWVWAFVKIPFAHKRPNNAIDTESYVFGPIQRKRGSISIVGPFPPVYPRNIPILVSAFVLAPLSLFAAFITFALTRPEITEGVAMSFLIGGVVVFVTRGIDTWREYFHNKGYQDHSPRSVLLIPFKYFFLVGTIFMTFLGIESVANVSKVIGAEQAVLILAAGKLWYDVRTHRLRRDDNRRGIFTRVYGSSATEIEPEPIDVPDGQPAYRFSMDRRVALIDAVAHGLFFGFGVMGLFTWPILGLGLLTQSLPIVLAGLGIGFIGSSVRMGARYLRYGVVEYRCYDEMLVAHDTLLQEPQARMADHAVIDITVSAGRLDRLFGTKTVSFDVARRDSDPAIQLLVPDPSEVSTGDKTTQNAALTLPHIEQPYRLTDTLDISWHLEESR